MSPSAERGTTSRSTLTIARDSTLPRAAISKSRSRWSGCMLQVDTNWHWFTISRATLVGIAMGCGDDFRPGPPNPSATLRCARRRSGSASFAARSRGSRRRSRSASRRCGGGTRYTCTARHRLRRTLRLSRRAAFRFARLEIWRAPSGSSEGRAPSKRCAIRKCVLPLRGSGRSEAGASFLPIFAVPQLRHCRFR